MRQKIYFLPFVLISVSCSQTNSKTETIDSTQLQTDTVIQKSLSSNAPVETAEPDESPIDTLALYVPEFSFYAQTLSEDKREDLLVKALGQLIDQFNQEKFATIKMRYTHDDAVTMGTVVEDETWYYNASRQLCAFSSEYKSDRMSMSSLYLCKEEDIIALSSDSEFQDEGAGYSNNVRIVTSSCPLCGLNLLNDNGEGYQTNVIDQSSLYQYTNDFFSKHQDQLKTFKGVTKLIKKEERYIAFVIVNSNAGTDTIKYSIDPNLIHTFFKNGEIQN